MGQLTESLIDFILSPASDDPPAEAIRVGELGFTDCVAVMIAGVQEPFTVNLRSYVNANGGPSRILLGQHKSSVAQATLVGVGAAHALDFDDYAFSNHVSALLVPAILADGERLGASGEQMLRAYITGLEVWGRVFKREPDHLHSKGWHPTGVFGPIGVSAALAKLRGYNLEKTRNALGLAVANGGGVMDNFGSQAKSYQGARAAEAGVQCVELAGLGVDAGPNAIDGPGGLLAALSPNGRADITSPADDLGKKWLSAKDGLNLKMHPTVGASQRGIDAAIQIYKDHRPDITNIKKVIARVSEKHAAVMRFHKPTNAMEAKFSLEFGVSTGLIAGKVGLPEVTDTFVRRDDVQDLIKKVVIEIGPDNDPTYPVGAIEDTVAVVLTDGHQIESEPVRRFRGHGMNPMTRVELQQKFNDCVSGVLDGAAAGQLFEQLQSLRDLVHCKDIQTLPI